ncbi:helix-turn-helix domain-containing protein [Streptomyces sp. WAC 04229]|uniref:helix-turn-helix domain-containing protein n=1 Tax=Streptomyces sp. WAC 04229 TaxID=2203206 RepID=UPI000F7425DF|nr:hypothetical protein [Streptomyces sp. WAC 04229]
MTDDETQAAAFTFKPAVPPHGPILSINEIVSYNLMRARRSNAWTQQEVADLLEKYTGRTWSNASVSAAERAWQGGRPRKFDASELVALTKIFDVPLGYFFLPPEDQEYANKWVSMKKFEGQEPPRGPEALDRHDFMALLPTADLLESVGAHKADLDYAARMKRLVKRYLGLDWRPDSWTIFIGTNPDTGELQIGKQVDEGDRVGPEERPEERTLEKPKLTWPLPDHLKEAEELVGVGNEVMAEQESWERMIQDRVTAIVEAKTRQVVQEIVAEVGKEITHLVRGQEK